MVDNENNRYRYEEDENPELKEEIKEDIKKEKEEKVNSSNQKQDNKKEKKDKQQEKINSLNKEIDDLKEQLAQAKKDVLIAKAEEVNFKKRIDEDKNKMVEYSNQRLLEKFITQLDMFDKVVSMPTEDPVLKNYLIGFEMINNNLKQVLQEEGVKKIIVKAGDKLDPKYHHALQTSWDENFEEDVILQELQSGYLYKDRVLRPTLVKVNKKEGK